MADNRGAASPSLRSGVVSSAALQSKPLAKCSKSDIPIASVFHEPWWLSAASDNEYEEVCVTEAGRVIARLPFLRIRKFGGQTALVMPALTHVLGPAIAFIPDECPVNQALREGTLYEQLINQLPKSAHVWFAMARSVTNPTPFEAAGFKINVDFTSELAPGDRDAIWSGMRDKTRNVIRRAAEALMVEEHEDPHEFFNFYENNLRARGRTNKFPRRLYSNVMEACIERHQGRILTAVDRDGTARAAIFTAWDAHTEHYLLSTNAPQSGNGATSLLLWKAIQTASGQNRIFDFDGIKHETNRLLISGFGGQMRPRYLVNKSSLGHQLGSFISRKIKKIFYKY